jgi:hypothetical protein
MAERRTEGVEILERGDIFFLYRPRVDEDDPSRLSDTQRFFIVLRPERERKLRLLVVGRKRLPNVEGHERTWGFVAKVAASPDAIEIDLREHSYETATRGEQRQPAARPSGEGRYVVALVGGQMHLAYVLELPEHPAEVQRALRIVPEASFALSVKNPDTPSPPGAGLGERQEADYPDRLQREFRGRRFAREDVRLLDVSGAEFILVGARTNPEQAYHVEVEAELPEYRPDVLKHLHMAKSRHPIEPLFEGHWA